ncbi:uncharacterized protein H isoform X1 [Diabrotica undecimpunctata]|uniref:uncharacterized protein H isoform X1 n=1 Tax=Diabrotica undecimpunctata TaxID=50387 RepID=UPI003B63766E
MHISEIQHPSTTILTKCTKMSEEGHKFGMNGNADRNIKEECHKTNYGQGGRLKFFKDGKFILELERAREGERVSWVSVPRKTFWPPQGTAATIPAYRQDNSTSLSVSDDNSSIQSSPWQRDHSWKQTSPSKNISKELKFYFWRPKHQRSMRRSNKRRQPLLLTAETQLDDTNKNKSEKTYVKVKKETNMRSLLSIIQYLTDKCFRTSTPPRTETVVSPRKRFLREMEKDKVPGDDNSQKRSRSKSQANQSISSVAHTSLSAPVISSPVVSNGVEETKPLRNSNYSITSLLAEDRNVKRSPTSSPSHYPLAHPQYCSPPPSTEERWYSESVDRLRSMELSQVEKCGYPLYSSQSYLHGYMYPFSPVPPYYGTGVYGRGYVVPSMYHHTSPVNVPARHETPTCSWVSVESRRDGDRREETVTDVPLNLSKNSG